MSDSIFRLIPASPEHVPSEEALSAARGLLRAQLPSAQEIEEELTPEVRFVDPGENLEEIRCPACSATIAMAWWITAMDEAHRTAFRNLTVLPPCCGQTTTLNDLTYLWPAGFARFSLEVLNPGIPDLPPGALAELETVLGTRLRLIRAHI